MNALFALTEEIAQAPARDEALLFARACDALETPELLRRRCATHAFADAAVLLRRILVPGHGYQFGETVRAGGLASIWRPRDAHALPFKAATPALALLRATIDAAQRRQSSDVAAACKRCGGLGWTIPAGGDKRLCSHL